ncbi:MAG: carboxypeptidase regulatory-like domain-containing protein [Armatimonadia bacterium]
MKVHLLTVCVLIALAALLLSGCGGVGPSTPSEPTAAVIVVYANDATTNEAITVDASAVAGGVRGALTVSEGSVVLRDVPFGTGTPPVQPVTVTAPGYVTYAELTQISTTVATFVTATLQPAVLSETGTVSGTVTSGGSPVTSALVKFTHTSPGGTLTEVRGYTDNTGYYKIGGIAIGSNTVTAEAEGYITSTQTATVVQDAGGGQNAALDFSLMSGNTRVDVVGSVVDAFTSVPLSAATLTLADSGTATSDASGEFRFTNVQVGQRLLTVTRSGYDQVQQTLTVLPGMARLRIQMSPSAPQPPGGPYNLQGVVTLNGADDNSGAAVTAVSTTSGRTLGTVVTEASGEYRMFLTPGEYRITVTYGTQSVRRTVTVPGGGRIISGVNFVLTVS